MSTRDYGYGLVLTANHLQMLAAKICPDYSESEWYERECEYAEDVCEQCGFEYITDFDGDAMLLLDNGTDAWYDRESYTCDTVYYLPLRRAPTLFNAAYKDIKEVVEEIKNKVGKYFPQDFNYRDNIRHIIGTHFG